MFSKKKWFYVFILAAILGTWRLYLSMRDFPSRKEAISDKASSTSSPIPITQQEKNFLLETLKPILSSLAPLDSLTIDVDENLTWIGSRSLMSGHFESIELLNESSILENCENRLLASKGEKSIQFSIVCRLTEEVRDSEKVVEAVKELESRLQTINQ